jgi:hypothetical protein
VEKGKGSECFLNALYVCFIDFQKAFDWLNSYIRTFRRVNAEWMVNVMMQLKLYIEVQSPVYRYIS